MPAVTLKKIEELPPEMRRIVETYEAWIGDTVFARVMAHIPEAFKAFGQLYELLLNGKVESEIKELARLKLAQLNDCHY
ncbi:MAG: hypothetical protein D6723_19130 [Acidobacteria bacterium]|nr:MAG: hypothetical protein D6723_19130 [Acidobacteriota bacterium]